MGRHEAATTTSSTPGSGSGSGTSTSAASPSSGLSGGAKAGIAVGVIVLVIALAAAVFFLWRRKKQRGRKEEAVSETTVIGTDGKAEMDNQPVERRELPTGEEAHELEEERRVIEMGNNEPDVTYELSGEPALPRSRGGVEEPLGPTTS